MDVNNALENFHSFRYSILPTNAYAPLSRRHFPDLAVELVFDIFSLDFVRHAYAAGSRRETSIVHSSRTMEICLHSPNKLDACIILLLLHRYD